jgi:hypothetical protein
MSTTVPNSVVITPTNHRFFDDLVTALAAQAALAAGYMSHADGSIYRFLDDWPMRLVSRTRRDGNSVLEIEVKPASILTPLTKFAWPTFLELKFEIVTEVAVPRPPAPTPVAAPLSGIKRMNANIMEHAFVAYYERYADEINTARSIAGAGSLPTLAFANVIRNAFAHGGTIHFKQAKIGVVVSWEVLTYSFNDNGRQIMYNDMNEADVILLMLEMDTLF